MNNPMSFQESAAKAFVKSPAWARNASPPYEPVSRRFMVAAVLPYGTLGNGWSGWTTGTSDFPSDGYAVVDIGAAPVDVSWGYTYEQQVSSFDDGTVITVNEQFLPYWSTPGSAQATNNYSTTQPGSWNGELAFPSGGWTVTVELASYSISYPDLVNNINGVEIRGGTQTGVLTTPVYYATLAAQAAAQVDAIAGGKPGQQFVDSGSGTNMLLGYSLTYVSEYLAFAPNLISGGSYNGQGIAYVQIHNVPANQVIYFFKGANETSSWSGSSIFLVGGGSSSGPTLALAQIINPDGSAVTGQQFGSLGAPVAGTIELELTNGTPYAPVTLFASWPLVRGLILYPIAGGTYYASYYDSSTLAAYGTSGAGYSLALEGQGIAPVVAVASNVRISASGPVNLQAYKYSLPPVGSTAFAAQTLVETVPAVTQVYAAEDSPSYGWISPVGGF